MPSTGRRSSGNEAVASILDTLARENVPGTFFLTGDFVKTFPESARRIGFTSFAQSAGRPFIAPKLVSKEMVAHLRQFVADTQRGSRRSYLLFRGTTLD